jgi:hypothetical protein
MTRTLVLLAVGLASSAAYAQSNQPVFQSPTATELFDLRSRCAALGDKLLEEISELPDRTKSLKSHYDPRTDHCYGELRVQIRNWYYTRTLYDLQTKEILATATTGAGLHPWGTTSGQSSDEGSDHGFTSADKYIAKMMQEDR